MLKIKQSESGYWFNSEWFYLDEIETMIYKRISFKDFKDDFCFDEYEEREWKGNNPFCKSDCQRYWLENEKMFVEIYVSEGEKTEITIHKVITNEYENSKDLMKDLLDLDELYNAILRTFEEYVDNIEISEKE